MDRPPGSRTDHQCQDRSRCRGTGKCHDKSRTREGAEQQTADDDPQTGDPDCRDEAVAEQHDQGNDIGEAGFDTRQRRRERRLDDVNRNRECRETGDEVVIACCRRRVQNVIPS